MAALGAPGAVRLGLVALGLVLAFSTTACGGPSPVVDVVSPQASGTAAPAADPPAAVVRPADPLAPSAYRPVVRAGRTPRAAVRPMSGNAGTGRSVRYADGVTVRLDRITRTVETGRGPGVFPGRPHTALSLTLVNRSPQAVDLGEVVVTTLYGVPARLAAPVYEDPAARDFSGRLPPGRSATATYVFAVPTDAAGTVVVIVDFDGRHVAARLAGR
jgi:hypothetical protein